MAQSAKHTLYGMTLSQLQRLCDEEHLPRFTAKQIAHWLYVKRVKSIDEMTNLSKASREALSERYTLGLEAPLRESISADGTKK